MKVIYTRINSHPVLNFVLFIYLRTNIMYIHKRLVLSGILKSAYCQKAYPKLPLLTLYDVLHTFYRGFWFCLFNVFPLT